MVKRKEEQHKYKCLTGHNQMRPTKVSKKEAQDGAIWRGFGQNRWRKCRTEKKKKNATD